MVGRLAASGTIESISAQVSTALAADPVLGTDFSGDLLPVVTHFSDHVFGTLSQILILALLAALMLLAVAVGNTVLLLLMTGSLEAITDAAVRQALGAPRSTLVARVSSDAALVGSVGAFVGVGLTWLVMHALLPLAPSELPRLESVSVDAYAVSSAVLVRLVSIAIAGAGAGLVLARTA